MDTFDQKKKSTEKTGTANPKAQNGTVDTIAHPLPSILHLQRTIGNQAVQRLLNLQTEDLGGGQNNSVSQPGDSLEAEADHVAEVVTTGGRAGPIRAAAPGARVSRKGDGKEKENKTDNIPWLGRIHGTYSAALRKTPSRDPNDPHAGTLADLPEGDFVEVDGRQGGWLHVHATVNGKELEGYVSQELVEFNRYNADPEEMKTDLTMRDAFVVLKRAETRLKANAAYKPGDYDKVKINQAIAIIKQEPKYQVNETTYQITFVKTPGKKVKVTTIEDFILFVEAVEAQYPASSAKDVVSEMRQLWFSDQNWDLMVASQGIKNGDELVDISAKTNPLAEMFDMDDLIPKGMGKVVTTPMGDVNIGHVMAGIDARLSGFPAEYPAEFLIKHGHGSVLTKMKYEILKSYSNKDPTMFATFAGDLGQAYANYIFDRYQLKNPGARLATYLLNLAKPEEILGDLHGYIAAAVSDDMRSSGKSPTNASDVTASGIIRDMYLVDKSAEGTTVNDYLERVSGKQGKELKDYIYHASMNFGEIWYVKLNVDKYAEKGVPGDLFHDYTTEFESLSDGHERNSGPDDTLLGALDELFTQVTASLK